VGLGARLVKSLRRRAKQAHDGIIAHVGYRIVGSGGWPLRSIASELHRARRRSTSTIARLSSSHDFAHSHDHLRRSMTRVEKKRQNMTIIISISPKPLQRSPHKFVNVMA
jgi:hypothetical protein